MSKYTIELGIALENVLSQHEKSVDNYVDVVDKSPSCILVREYPSYVEELVKKMVQNKYYDELCVYPWGKWKIMLDGELSKNLSRYDSIYKEISKELNMLDNMKLTLTDIFSGNIEQIIDSKMTTNSTSNMEGNTSSTATSESSSRSNALMKKSDTPQSNINNLDNGYLSSATQNEDSTSTTNTGNDSSNSTQSSANTNNSESETLDTKKSTDLRTQEHTGKNTSETYLDLISGINEKIVNLTEIFIDDMSCMFFGLL